MSFRDLNKFAKELGEAFISGMRDDVEPKSAPAPVPEVHVDVTSNRPSGFVSMECPKCGGAIQVPANQETCYCSYCGTQLHLDDGSVNITYRMVDETKIRELEAKTAVELKRMEIEEKYRPLKVKAALIMVLIGAALILIGGIVTCIGVEGGVFSILVGLIALMLIIPLWDSGSNASNKEDG